MRGKPKPCKFRGVIETCFGTFPLTSGMRETCDNPACKKELRAQTHRPAVRKYDAANRGPINARRRKNYPVKRGRINELRRKTTAANRKLKPCKITTIADADLPTDGLRATFAKVRKTCLGAFYPKGKQQTCSTPCSDALEKLGQYKRQLKWNRANKVEPTTLDPDGNRNKFGSQVARGHDWHEGRGSRPSRSPALPLSERGACRRAELCQA